MFIFNGEAIGMVGNTRNSSRNHPNPWLLQRGNFSINIDYIDYLGK